jgi:putative drug exporter of the RND superfamily
MPTLARLSAIASGPRSRWVVVGAWVAVALAMVPLLSELEEEAADESDTFLVRGSESAEVERIVDAQFERGSEMAAVIAYVREGGLTGADRRRIEADALELCSSAQIPSLTLIGTPYALACGETDPRDLSPGPSLLLADDGTVALTSVLMTDESTPVAEQAVDAIRMVAPPPEGDEGGLAAYVTGEAGFEADRSEAVQGIDETLLAVTVAVLLVLLLVIYRSPLVALVPLVVVALAYLVAAGVTYGLVAAGLTGVSGQTTAILIVLMFGVGTDYYLLIVARFRDELRRTADVGEAMSRAAERTGPAILSAGAIVIVAMLVLALADFNATREMGPILALGVAIMVVAGLTLLPAILAALGRRAFWPAIPAVTHGPAPTGGLWRRVGGLVRGRPGLTAAAVTATLVSGALGGLGGRESLDFSEQFRDAPDSVAGQEVIAEHFVPGRVAPLRLVTDFDAAEDVLAALTGGAETPVEEAYLTARSVEPPGPSGPPGTVTSELALADAYLGIDPFSDEATDAVPELRETARRAAGGGLALIGGEVAEAYDTRRPAHPDPDPHHPRGPPPGGDHAALCDRHRGALVRLRARRELADLHPPSGPAGERPQPDAVRVHLPRRARRRLQRVPARSDPGGEAPGPISGNGSSGDRGTRAHRGSDHQRRPRARRHLQHADGAAARGAVPGRVRGRPRAPGRHVPGSSAARALARGAARRAQLVAVGATRRTGFHIAEAFAVSATKAA